MSLFSSFKHALRSSIRGFRAGAEPEWEAVSGGWAAGAQFVGWSHAAIAEQYARRWPSFMAATRELMPLAANHEAPAPDALCFDTHNHVMSLAYVASRVAAGRNEISLLDYGGALGQTRIFLAQLFPQLSVDYTVCEVDAVCKVGERLHPSVRFCRDGEWEDRSYDLVMASNVLQYSEDWRATLRSLAAAARTALWVARLPIAFTAPSFVVRQNATRYGYATSYLGWCLNRDEFLAALGGNNMNLIREFLAFAHQPQVANAPENPTYRSFLAEPSKGA